MSNEAELDPYALDDSVNVMGAGTVTIDNASFGYDANYGDALCIIFEGNVVSDGETYDWRKLFSVGKGWEAADQGARAVRGDGKVKNFRADSKYGMFLTGALASGAGDTLRKRGVPQDASIWSGLVFEIEGGEKDYGGEIGVKKTLTPVKFLGEAGKASAAASSTPSAPKPAAAASASSAETVSGALKAKLKKLAKECDTHDAFIDRAFVEVDGVDGNKAAEALVADSADFYEEARA